MWIFLFWDDSLSSGRMCWRNGENWLNYAGIFTRKLYYYTLPAPDDNLCSIERAKFAWRYSMELVCGEDWRFVCIYPRSVFDIEPRWCEQRVQGYATQRGFKPTWSISITIIMIMIIITATTSTVIMMIIIIGNDGDRRSTWSNDYAQEAMPHYFDSRATSRRPTLLPIRLQMIKYRIHISIIFPSLHCFIGYKFSG